MYLEPKCSDCEETGEVWIDGTVQDDVVLIGHSVLCHCQIKVDKDFNEQDQDE